MYVRPTFSRLKRGISIVGRGKDKNVFWIEQKNEGKMYEGEELLYEMRERTINGTGWTALYMKAQYIFTQ